MHLLGNTMKWVSEATLWPNAFCSLLSKYGQGLVTLFLISLCLQIYLNFWNTTCIFTACVFIRVWVIYCFTLLHIVVIKNSYADTMCGSNKQPENCNSPCVYFFYQYHVYCKSFFRDVSSPKPTSALLL